MSDGYGEEEYPEATGPGEPRRSAVPIVAVVVALLLVAALAWWFLRGGSSTDPSTSATPAATVTETVTATPSETASPEPSGTASSSPTATATEESCEDFGGFEASESSDDWFADLAGESLWGVEMRVGTHDCYDRWVFEFDGDGDMPGWAVTPHDSNTFLGDPSGEDIEPLAGSASLEVMFAAWPDGTPIGGDELEGDTEIVTDGFPAIQEARIISGFEGMTQVGIGLDKSRPYTVTWMEDPGRLVIDVYNG